jgi:hypothetical protein
VPVAEFVGLRPKMNSILKSDSKELKKAKGVKKNVVKKQICHQQYKESLFEKKVFHHGMNSLRSEGHKFNLSPMDTKRLIAADGIHTLAHGHKDTRPGRAMSADMSDATRMG